MSFTDIQRVLLRIRARRGGGYASFFGGDAAAVESAIDDIIIVRGVTGRAGSIAAVEHLIDSFASYGFLPGSGAGQFTPTHFVSASATGSGDGTVGSPFTLAQACALAQPGWIVECSGAEFIGPNTGGRFAASFEISANGTAENPIIFYAENYAAINSSGRTYLRNTATSQGNGCPVLGLKTGHHWYGFAINEDTAPTRSDTGPIVCSGSHNRISYFHVDRGAYQWPNGENNHAAIRFEGNGCRNNLVSDCLIRGYSGGSGSEQAIQMFSSNNNPAQTTGLIVIEHCVFDNNQFAVTVKGAGSARPIHGGIIFRRNLVRTTSRGDSGGISFMDTGAPLGRNQVYLNVFLGGNCAVRTMNQAGYPVADVDIINNTAINLAPHGDDFYGFHADRYEIHIGTGWRVHNNVNYGTAVPFFRSPYSAANDSAILSRSHNISQSSLWGYVSGIGSSVQTLAQWVARGKDQNSLVANPMLQATTWGDVNLGKLQPGSPAIGMGVDILNLLGGGTSGAINAGAFIQTGMTDIIGIRPLE